jgi:hypothetical protein
MESPEEEEEEEEFRATDIEDICEVDAASRPLTSSVARPLASVTTSTKA